MRRICILLVSSAAFLIGAGGMMAQAATATSTLNVQITIQAECTIVSVGSLDFGAQGVIDANIDQSSTISIQCTDGTPYEVGLDAGAGSGATVATRLMTGPASATISYGLYQDAARSVLWGETTGVDVVTGTGDGNAQALTVYGRVPPQATPGAGVYADTVTVTVTY